MSKNVRKEKSTMKKEELMKIEGMTDALADELVSKYET